MLCIYSKVSGENDDQDYKMQLLPPSGQVKYLQVAFSVSFIDFLFCFPQLFYGSLPFSVLLEAFLKCKLNIQKVMTMLTVRSTIL